MTMTLLYHIKRSLEKSTNIERDSYIWNFVYSTLSACQSAFILMVVTRTNGLYDAGIFSLAYAVAGLMVLIGQYGVRKYQSSDIEEAYDFAEYFYLRILTCIVMMVTSALYCVWCHVFDNYSMYKALIIFLLCGLKCIQAIVDVLHGRLQQKDRLDIAGKASSIRSIFETTICIVVLIVTRNLTIAIAASIVASIISTLLTSLNVVRDYCKLKIDVSNIKIMRIKMLLIKCFPLFISTFLSMYISNVPKYAIDEYLSEQIQAYYNILFMPAFAIGLLSNFIFNPILTSYAKLWNERKIKKLKSLISKQICVIVAIMLVGILIAFTIGIPLLSLLFGINMEGYEIQLSIVIIGGGMLAYTTFFSTVITIIRCQHILLFGYIAVSILAKLLSGFFVVNYNITGAVMLYTLLMAALAVFFVIAMIVYIKKYSR